MFSPQAQAFGDRHLCKPCIDTDSAIELLSEGRTVLRKSEVAPRFLVDGVRAGKSMRYALHGCAARSARWEEIDRDDDVLPVGPQ